MKEEEKKKMKEEERSSNTMKKELCLMDTNEMNPLLNRHSIVYYFKKKIKRLHSTTISYL
jgi:hypothetical protein